MRAARPRRQVVAEGVESDEQRDAFLGLGGRLGQGHLFGGGPAARGALRCAPAAGVTTSRSDLLLPGWGATRPHHGVASLRRPGGGIGRRRRLKPAGPQGREGSSPSPGTLSAGGGVSRGRRRPEEREHAREDRRRGRRTRGARPRPANRPCNPRRGAAHALRPPGSGAAAEDRASMAFDGTALCVGSMAPDLAYPLGPWLSSHGHAATVPDPASGVARCAGVRTPPGGGSAVRRRGDRSDRRQRLEGGRAPTRSGGRAGAPAGRRSRRSGGSAGCRPPAPARARTSRSRDSTRTSG